MKFLAILSSVLLITQTRVRNIKRSDAWILFFIRFICNTKLMQMVQPIGRYFIVLTPLCILVSIVFYLLSTVAYGLPSLALQILLLTYLLLPAYCKPAMKSYIKLWRSKKFVEAKTHFLKSFHCDLDNSKSLNDRLALHKFAKNTMLYWWLDRFFVVIFWFLVFGIGGAMVPILTTLYLESVEDQDERRHIWPIQHAIEWIPSRLLVVSFGITGSFVGTFKDDVRSLFLWDTGSRELLAKGADNALELSTDNISHIDGYLFDNNFVEKAAQELESIFNLMKRSAVFWVFIVALISLLPKA